MIRRHDRYVLRAFLSALGAALLVLTSLVILFDLVDRLGKLSAAGEELRARGMSVTGSFVEYYLTYIPFLWLKILPIAVVLAAGLSITWLASKKSRAANFTPRADALPRRN